MVLEGWWWLLQGVVEGDHMSRKWGGCRVYPDLNLDLVRPAMCVMHAHSPAAMGMTPLPAL